MTASTIPHTERREPPVATPAGAPASSRWSEPLREAALAVLVIVSASAFGRVFAGGWGVPVLVTATGALAVSAVTRRVLASPLAGVLVDVTLTALLAVWTVMPSTTSVGLPLSGTWRAIGRAWGQLAPAIAAASPPARPLTPFLLLAAVGTGAVALLASWVAFRVGRLGWATAPALVLFVSCCVLGTRRGRALSVGLEVAATGLWLLVELATERRDAARWLGPRQSSWGAVRAGARVAGLGVVVALLATSLFSGSDGRGALGWKPSGDGRTRIIVTPMVTLTTRLHDESTAPAFRVESPVPSYWQLTTLDVYSGDTWQTGRTSYSSFGSTLPSGGARAPAGTRKVRETVHIQQLDSPWLPVAFTPVAVSGTSDVQYSATTGSLLTEKATANGLTYTVTSLQYLSTLDPAELAAAPAVRRSEVPAGSLVLPATVPASVGALARRVVAGHRSEYAKALALQDFFHQRTFTYSLDPPSDGSTVSALTTFLFSTHTGYCQQFAGAFAVMARAIGLPTRLAIGFTTGTRVGPDTYQVTDADAHTWPEVWFPRYGWVPFEPTKGTPGSGFAIPGASQYTGDTAAPSVGSITVPTTRRTGPDGTATRPSRRLGRSALGDHGGSAAHPGVASDGAASTGSPAGGNGHPGSWVWILDGLAAAAAALILLVLANLVARRARRLLRRRRARGPGRDPLEQILVVWDEIAETLARAGLRRHVAETLPELAARAAGALGDVDLGRALEEVALLTEAACWDARPAAGLACDRLVKELDRLARRVASAVDARLTRWERLALLADPRPSWRPRSARVPAAPPDVPARRPVDAAR